LEIESNVTALHLSGPAATKTADGPTLEQCRARAHQFILNGESRQIEPQMAVSITPPADRSIIPKMLSTPEQLAIMALALKNFNDVKYIIEVSLKNAKLFIYIAAVTLIKLLLIL